MKSELKTIGWHQLDGTELVKSSLRKFKTATHRVVGETENCWVYATGWVKINTPGGDWMTNDLSELASEASDLLKLDIWDADERETLKNADS